MFGDILAISGCYLYYGVLILDDGGDFRCCLASLIRGLCCRPLRDSWLPSQILRRERYMCIPDDKQLRSGKVGDSATISTLPCQPNLWVALHIPRRQRLSKDSSSTRLVAPSGLGGWGVYESMEHPSKEGVECDKESWTGRREPRHHTSHASSHVFVTSRTALRMLCISASRTQLQLSHLSSTVNPD